MGAPSRLAGLATATLLVACGGAAGAGGDAGAGGGEAGARIEIEGFAFPSSTAVAPGGTITVVNLDDEPHTVTAQDGGFDTGQVTDQAMFTAPQEAGSYDFHCEVHPSMTATLVVGDAGAATEEPSEEPTEEPTEEDDDGGGYDY